MHLDVRNRLITDNFPLVVFLAADLCSRARHLSRDDLVSVGSIALTKAADAFDPSRGVPFGGYARHRIIGAFADELRTQEWTPRGVRKKITATTAARESLTASLGRPPTVQEIAGELGVPATVVSTTLEDASRVLVSLESYDMGEDEACVDIFSAHAHTRTPEEHALVAERVAFVRDAVASLPDKVRYVIEQLYFEDRSVKDIAAELEVTHSAVSHHRAAGMRLLREAVEAHYGDEPQPAAPQPATAGEDRTGKYLSALGERFAGGLTRPTLARAS